MATTPLSNYGHRFKNWLDDFAGKVEKGEEHWSTAKQTGEAIVELGKQVHAHSGRVENMVDDIWDRVYALDKAKDQMDLIMKAILFGFFGAMAVAAVLKTYCPFFQ